MRTSWRTRLSVLAVLALFATMVAALPASATSVPPSDQVETGAEIGAGEGLNPTIVCKWELPDYNRNAADGMQYGDDDLPEFDAGYPCHGVDPNTVYEQNWVVIDVTANAEDQPTERLIELWSAVYGAQNTQDVDSVIWDIWHPDGTHKVQVHGERYEGSQQSLGATFNTGTGEYDLSLGGMWYAASAQTGQIAQDTARSQQGLVARAAQGDVQLWHGAFELSKHQPCGLYTVENYATYLGYTTWTYNYINVMCFVNLEADFDSVEWGAVTPGGTDWVYGDLAFAQGDGYPTVMNTGSGAMGLGLEFSAMKGVSDEDPNSVKLITEFDGMFGINPDYLQHIDPIVADQDVVFDFDYWTTLCANEVGKLDLSIHPPLGLPADTYTGSLTLYAYHVEGAPWCLNEVGVWDPPHVRFPADPE